MFKAYRLLSAGVLLWAGSFSLASAAVFNVNTVADVVDNDTTDGVCMTAAGDCSLRAAIQQANATPEADVIELASGIYRFTLAGDRDAVALSGDLDVLSDITINGRGSDQTVVDAMKLDRVFQVHDGGKLVLNKMTVRNGVVQFGAGWGGAGIDVSGGQLTVNDSNVTLNYAFAMGGGISNFNGTVTLNRSVIAQNKCDGQGGGIFNQDGKLSINDTEISANDGARFFGGGIYNSAMAEVLEINNSTITGHGVFSDGGAIYHLLGGLKITNSTISNNTAGRHGGGLFIHNGSSNLGEMHELLNVTIANNNSGIYVEGNVKLETANTIFANRRSNCNFNGVDAKLVSLGHNLDTDGSCMLSTDSSSFSSAEAGLAALAANGGVTRTHGLLAGSEALDAGDDALCPLNDQRGYTRPAADCDIGAFEAGAVAPTVVQSAPPVNQDSSTTNTAPIAFNQPLVVNAGGAVTGVFSAVDVDGDALTFYQIDQQPTQGDVGRGRIELIPGEFIYTASADAIGTDMFTFYVCDALNACSEPATISVTIGSEPIASEMVVELTPGTSAQVSPLTVVAPSNLDVTAADLDYSKPFGVFYFDVQDIPTAADLEAGTVVVIQLPPESVISPDAVIRKLDVTGTWQTLQSAPSAVVSTGVIDAAAKTLTLILRDNDMFDANPELGVIRDPVAIAVSKSVDASVQDLQATVAVPVVEPEPVVVSEPVSVAEPESAPAVVEEAKLTEVSSGGSGSFNPLLLAALGLLMLRRRKSC